MEKAMLGIKSLTQIVLTFFVLVLSSSLAFAQLLSQPDIRINIFWDFYSNNRLSTINAGKGYTGIAGDNDISGVILNPASLNVNKKFQVHAEYLYKSNVPWLTKIVSTLYLTEYHPSFMAAFGYKFNDYFQTGLLYYTANSQKLDFGEITITNEFGDPISTFEPYDQVSISSIALPIAFNYRGKLKAGINLLYTFYHGYSYLGPWVGSNQGPAEGKANFRKFNVQFGVLAKPFKDLSVGFTFLPKVEQNVVWEWPQGVSDAFTAPNVFPMKIGFGTEYRFSRIPLKLEFDYIYTNFSKQEGLKDRNDFHFGAEYALLKSLYVRTGFFTLKDYRSGDNYLDPIGQYDEYFLTFGGTYRFKNFSVSAALLDSHVLSTGLIKQTVVNGGLTLDL